MTNDGPAGGGMWALALKIGLMCAAYVATLYGAALWIAAA